MASSIRVTIICNCVSCGDLKHLDGATHSFPIEVIRKKGWDNSNGDWLCPQCIKYRKDLGKSSKKPFSSFKSANNKQTVGRKIAKNLFFGSDLSTALYEEKLVRLVDTNIKRRERAAAWDAYRMSFNGVLPAGIEAVFGKDPHEKVKGRL